MGVPGLYKCLLKRYPLIQQDIVNLPTFDYFYIDLNGVIHQMSHATEELRRTRAAEEIFHDICDYIDSLVKIVNPQCVLFLCVDGVAPLAKVIQQRSRRYKGKEISAINNKPDTVEESFEANKTSYFDIYHFDRNCITPGTQFMEDLHKYLLHFIDEKSQYDYSWKSIQIVYSGYNVPGEGEHKIMDFIRSLRSNPSYDINSTHCFHGLDADLILLGLVTHLKNVAILRENQSLAGKIHLGCEMRILYISILRDYIELEFSHLKEKLLFKYEFDRLLNDWILLACLIGNDFLPNIPCMYIRSGGLFKIWDTYKAVLPSLKDYITCGDQLNIHEFITFLKLLSSYESDHVAAIEMKFMKCNSKNIDAADYSDFISKTYTFSDVILNEVDTAEDNSTIKIFQNSPNDELFLLNDELDLMHLSDDLNDEIDECNKTISTIIPSNDDKQLKSLNNDRQHKNLELFKTTYYKNKLHLDYENKKDILKICFDFVATVSWILQYYNSGLRDWRYIYPYHYAPFISDITLFCADTYKMAHLTTTPIEPFTQLLCVQPPASVDIIPKAYQSLVVDINSPIIDLFPIKFVSDLNGKKYEFESVILLPFIHIDRIFECTDNIKKKNSEILDDVKNIVGSVYLWRPKTRRFELKLSENNLNIFSIIEHILSYKTYIHPFISKLRQLELFPSFSGVPHNFYYLLKSANGGKFFRLVLKIGDNLDIDYNSEECASNDDGRALKNLFKHYINKIVYFDFPYSRVGVIKEIILTNGRIYKLKEKRDSVEFQPLSLELSQIYDNQRASLDKYFQSSGINISSSSAKILFRIHDLVGFKYIPMNSISGILRPQWSHIGEYYPSNIVITGCSNVLKKLCYDAKLVNSNIVFEPKSSWLAQSDNAYKTIVKLSHTQHDGIPRCFIKLPLPVTLKLQAFNRPLYSNYMTIKSLAQLINIHTKTLLLFLTKINVVMWESWTKINIALDVYDRKNELEIPGFSLYYNKHFLVSIDIRDSIINYKKKFSGLFDYIDELQANWKPEDGPFTSGLRDTNFYDKTKCDIDQVFEFIKIQPSYCMQKYNSGSISIDNQAAKELCKTIESFKEPMVKSVSDFISPMDLNFPYKPKLSCYSISKHLPIRLLDRVVIIAKVSGIPLGADGFVISVSTRTLNNPKIPLSSTSKMVNLYVEVLFTKPHRFTSKFSGRLPNSCIIPYDWTFNMSKNLKSNNISSCWMPYIMNNYIDYDELMHNQIYSSSSKSQK